MPPASRPRPPRPDRESALRLPRSERARIAQARDEAGETAVAPPLARRLAAAFALLAAAPAVAQLGLDPGFFLRAPGARPASAGAAPDSVFGRVRAVNRDLLARAEGIEDRLADDSVLGRRVRPVVQDALTGWLRAGTSQVEVGVDGWLFYRPDVDHVTGPGFLSAEALARRAAEGDTLAAAPHPDPRPALVGFHEQLERRGVRLIVAPTPVKPSADPRQVGRGGGGPGPVRNRSWRRFARELERAGVTVFDAGRTLSALRREGAGPLYLAADTHWRPETMRRVAADLAALVERQAALSAPAAGWRARRVEVTGRGDTARLLDPGPRPARGRAETVEVIRVETPAGEAWTPDRSAEVLLLGDSFTNVFSLASLGWGVSAGLAEHLAFALGRPVDRLSQNDDGAFAPRRLLAAELARDAERLANTRVVIYQFAARELSQGDWRPIRLEAAPAPAAGGAAFWEPGVDSTAVVEATVAAAGAVPVPGSVPYRDHIVALHVEEIDVLAGPAVDAVAGAVVYVRSMVDNELTAAAGWRAGDRVRLALRSWAAVAPELDGISRGELDDPRLLPALPWWGAPVEE